MGGVSVGKADTARPVGSHMDTATASLPSVATDASKYLWGLISAIGLLLKTSQSSTDVAQDLHL